MSPERERTMMFRKLYWVVEHLDEKGSSRIQGVFTSIPDLIRIGLKTDAQVRLTLAKLDTHEAPFGCWTGPEFDGLGQKLEEFIATDEFTREQCQALIQALNSKVAA